MSKNKIPEIWKTVLKHSGNSFTITDIHKHHKDVPRSTIKSYLEACVAGGFLKTATPRRAGATFRYVTVRTPKNPPHVNSKGQIIYKDNLEASYMWRAMKMMKRFTPIDLAIHASTEKKIITQTKALRYIKVLCEVGYIKLLSTKHSAKSNYMFVTNTGFYAPVLTTKTVVGVFDKNNNEIKWAEEGHAHG